MLSFTACPDISGKSRLSGKKLDYSKYLLIIISLVLISIQIQAQYGWSRITYLPTPRAGATASVVDGKIYVIGGSTTGLVDAADNEMYDPLTDTWDTTLTPMPTPRGFLTSEVVNGIIYAIGGGFPDATNKIEAYNPVTDTWDTTLLDMPGEPRLGMRAEVVNGIIYVVAGNYNQRDFYAYDSSTNTWDTLASMPGGGGALSVTVYNGLFYTFGGSTDPIWTPVNTVYAYNPQTDTWDTTLTPMETPRFTLQTYLVGDTIFAVGGSQSQGTSLATVEAYYPITDTWDTKPNMPIDRSWFAGVVALDLIYVIAGTTDWSNNIGEVWRYGQIVDIVEELTPPSNFTLEQNYPNPFNPSTVIGYQLPIGSDVTLKVYDLLGREITTLVDEHKPAGNNKVEFNARQLPSGVYFYQLKAGDFIETKKMLLLK